MRDLGATRVNKETPIQPDVGVDGIAKPGDRVEGGARFCRVHARSDDEARRAAERLRAAFVLEDLR